MASPGEVEVSDDAAARRFVARDGSEVVGHLAYARTPDGALDLRHTEVDPPRRGAGIGEALVRAALAHARREGLRVIPSCPFVAAYLEAHPGDRDLVAGGA